MGVALALAEESPEGAELLRHAPRVLPLPGLRKEEKAGRIAAAEAAAKAAEREEHWRLLYVAMTRAEEALFVTGSLSPRETAPAPDSWYARIAEVMPDDAWQPHTLWQSTATHGEMPPPAPPRHAETQLLPLPVSRPRWLTTPAGEEPAPPRPLAPSSLGEDESADPPHSSGSDSAERERAALRGTLIHKLLERLPDLPADRRADAAARWLARNAAKLPESARQEIAQAALKVLAVSDWAELFGPDALAEVPVAATVSGRVIAGTIDRLLITPERLRLIDFKTARRPPASLDQVPVAILRQMAAYAAALEATFPGRAAEIALLYTHEPRLIAIPPEILQQHKPDFA
jgi:ATP-dependent helicase/nuclease subunit A